MNSVCAKVIWCFGSPDIFPLAEKVTVSSEIAQFDLDAPNIVEMLAEADLEFADWTGVSEEKRDC